MITKSIYSKIFLSIVFVFSFSVHVFSQRTLETQISDSLTVIANKYTYIGRVKIQNLLIDPANSHIVVNVNNFFAYVPFRHDNVNRVYNALKAIFSTKYPDFSIVCVTEGKPIEEFIPNYFRTGNIDSTKLYRYTPASHPLITDLSRPYNITNGLQNRHIALWQSHGKYYDQKRLKWSWQRVRLFQTVEDLYTQSFVLPYLVPMIENAGANTLLPRERDTQLNEVIVDNDSSVDASVDSRYREKNDRKSWTRQQGGFAHLKHTYIYGDNPFMMGTYSEVEAVNDKDELSSVEWVPVIPKEGRYAVYISYKSLSNSAPDARYTVYHKGIKNEFQVNQTMNGSTWVYLGHFYFDKGRNNRNRIVLTNFSAVDGKVITADAVKIGGGMGNMGRSPFVEPPVAPLSPVVDSTQVPVLPQKPVVVYAPEISHYPRYTEGARYWLQWAGVPDSVYSRTHGKDDYSDDFQSRGFWVNYVAGGSSVLPDVKGLNVPIDMALAFHSDAGLTNNDSIIGTLGINTIPNTWGKMQFANGVSRWASRDLTDIVMTQIVTDVQKTFAPEWTRRGMWNKSYSEARVPEVPTMLLELLSHQNYADMRYGLDPRFRFTVSRAIYKGILRYLSISANQPYVVQPLPVEQFSCHFVAKNKVQLHWEAVTDTLEPTAEAEQYRLYTRVDDGDFDNGVMLHSNTAIATLETGKIYSFKVVAVNKGGQSFPSEILSAYKAPSEKGQVLIVNGFDRICGPLLASKDSIDAGLASIRAAGVPYLSDISYVGKPNEFLLGKIHAGDAASDSSEVSTCCETMEIAGNNFDYPYVHGKAIKAAGYSFASASLKAVTGGYVDLTSIKILDVILGKQKQTFIGNAKKTAQFKTFPLDLQHVLEDYCNKGGNLLLSGAYIGSDILENDKSGRGRKFTENVLHYKFAGTQSNTTGNVVVSEALNIHFRKMNLEYYIQPNSTSYFVEAPDAIEPAGEHSIAICKSPDTNKAAGVAFLGKYKVCSFAFPLEIIKEDAGLADLMQNVLQFFAVSK